MIKRIIKWLLFVLVGLVPLPILEQGIAFIVSARTRKISPEHGLQLVLGLDNRLYHLAGQLAVAYDGGRHAKHRLTGYVDHFANLAANLSGPYLDIGCGNGDLMAQIADRVEDRIVGIDIEPDRIKAANERYKRDNLLFLQGDATVIDLGSTFSTLVLSNVLEHIEHRPLFLRRLVEQFCPEQLLIRVPLFERDWRVSLKKELGLEWRLDATHFTEYTEAEFLSEMKVANFAIKSMEIRWSELWVVAEPMPVPAHIAGMTA